MHTQICKSILKVNRATPNNTFRAELGQYLLLINIQKRAVEICQQLKRSDPSSYQAMTAETHRPNKLYSHRDKTTLPVRKMPRHHKRR